MDKAKQLCQELGVSGNYALELAENIVFLADKLARTRALINNMEVVIPYDNGGGQKGIRENPAFTAYEKLVRTYSKLVADFEAIAIAQGKNILNVHAQIESVSTPISEMKKQFASNSIVKQ